MNKTKFCTLIIFIAISFSNSIHAQVNFQSGFIIDNNHDTIKGFIDYQNWDINPNTIKFKPDEGSIAKNYATGDIKGFGVDGKIYNSSILPLEECLYDEKEVKTFEKYKYRTDTVFLQVLIKGEKNLYIFKNKDSKVYFFIGQEGNYQWLIYRSYFEKQYDNVFEKMDEKYKGQLNLYFQDCPRLQERIARVEYNSRALISLFNEYYKCDQREITYQYKVSKFRPEYGFIGGLSLAELKFQGADNFSSITRSIYPTSRNITFGVFYGYVFPQKIKKFTFHNELLFNSYKSSSVFVNSPGSDIYSVSTSSIGNSSFRLYTLLRYQIPFKSMFLYINGGITNGFSISQTNELRVEDHVFSMVSTSEGKALDYPQKWDKGYVLGFGSIIKRLSCELRMGNANGMSSYLHLKSHVNQYYFLIGCRLGK